MNQVVRNYVKVKPEDNKKSRPRTEEHKQKIREGNLGVKRSEETKKRMSIAATKRNLERPKKVPYSPRHKNSWDYISGRKEIDKSKGRNGGYEDIHDLLSRYKDKSEVSKKVWRSRQERTKDERNKIVG